MRKTHPGKGFTLIELLVVIAIIALLMAILMPALQRTKHQAQRVVCAAHLKSCGHAGVLYSNDNEGQFPYCHMNLGNQTAGTSWGSYAVWVKRLSETDPLGTQGYIAHGLFSWHGLIKDPKLYYCPANRNAMLQYGEDMPEGKGGGWPRGGRVPEDLGPGQEWICTTYHYRSLWDGRKWRSVNSAKDGGGMAFMADVFSDPERGVRQHHKDGYNVVYTDGHSEYVKDKENRIEQSGSGLAYNGDHGRQDRIWKDFFDTVVQYDRFYKP